MSLKRPSVFFMCSNVLENDDDITRSFLSALRKLLIIIAASTP